MKADWAGKVIALFLLLVCLTLVFHWHERKLGELTRAEFLEQQGRKYDKRSGRQTPFAIEFMACALLAGGFVGVYELLGMGCARLVEASQRPVEPPMPPVN